jgi:prepilin signal peptidase PulO-like enzyme (type II secretory pathway)
VVVLPVFLQIIFVAAAGLMLGSFATALTWREGKGLPWAGRERSRCPHCGATLTVRDLIPLFSWLFLRGRCRHCRAPIGFVYPLTELAAAAMALALWAAWGWGWALLALLPAIPFLLALLIIDARQMILPDRLNVLLGIVMLVFSVYQSFTPEFSLAVLGWSVAAGAGYAAALLSLGLFMKFLLKKEALGFGDVKFFAVAGLGLGFMWMPGYFILSGLCGVLTGIFWRICFKSQIFPFGPAIIIAFFVCLLLKGAGLVLPPGLY